VKGLSLVAFDLLDAQDLLSRLGPVLHAELGMTPAPSDAAVDVVDCFSQSRRQYDARRVLGRLAEEVPGDFVLAVTGADLFMPVFTFVLGEAHLGGKAAVVSTFRLAEERYGLAPDPPLLFERLCKEAVHELGHCLGLTHCMASTCAMYSSSGVEEVDLKRLELCERCRAKTR
jgi:archaemetzincin